MGISISTRARWFRIRHFCIHHWGGMCVHIALLKIVCINVPSFRYRLTAVCDDLQRDNDYRKEPKKKNDKI